MSRRGQVIFSGRRGAGSGCVLFLTPSISPTLPCRGLADPGRFLPLKDVCAGAILVVEAGGRFVPSQPPADYKDGDPIPDADLGSRLYLAIRPCLPTPHETAREQQDRLIKEVWRRSERLDYVRPV